VSSIRFLTRIFLLLIVSIVAVACNSGNSGNNDNPTPTVIMDGSNGGVANNATNVSLDPIIVLKFSQVMNPLTIDGTTVSLVAQNGNSVAIGSIIANTDNTGFTFSPESALESNTKYMVNISNGVKSQNGKSIVATSFSFTTGSSYVPTVPTVAIIQPANNATNVSKSPIITLQFNEQVQNVNTTTVTLHQGSATGTIIPTGSIVAGDNNTYTFSPSTPLESSASYYVVLTNGITSLSNIQLVNVAFSFTTGDFTVPTVQMTTPSNNAESVSLTPNITLQFSQPVQNVTTSTVTLRQGSATGSIVATGNITAGDNNTYTFSPSNPLNSNTAYYVVLTSGITNLSNTPLANTSFSFTTVRQWVNLGNAGFSAGQATYTSLAIAPNGTKYVAYADGGNGNKATVMMFNGTSWVTVGSAGFSAGSIIYMSLAIAPDGTPYVAYEDSGHGNYATVMMFNGTNWAPVGSAGFSGSVASCISLAIAPNGTPYIAYEDNSFNHGATVMMFNGTNWVLVGSREFSADIARNQSLAISQDGALYVAYEDSGNGERTTVMTFDGTNWVPVGSVGFSASVATNQSLAIAPDGTPYVAYEDGGNSNKATVMKFDGTNWVNVGNAGFSAGTASSTSLAIASDGTPYVAYQDGGNKYKATVMMFDGANWVDAGSAGFSDGTASYTSLAIAPDGSLYVAYEDGVNSNKATVMVF
jgi:methionine-rich copper-binding protein CopC